MITNIKGFSRLNDIGSTVSFQNDAVGDGKVFTFLFSRWFLDESGGNKTLRKWEHWLWGCKIRILIDHKPLSYLDSLFARRNPSLTRWNIFLQAWNIVTEYR